LVKEGTPPSSQDPCERAPGGHRVSRGFQTMALAIVLAYCFGYSFTLVLLLRGGMALRAALMLAFLADTLSITVMEIQRRDAPRSRSDGCWLGGRAFLGVARLRSCRSLGRRLSGQPLPDNARNGTCPSSRRTRTPLGALGDRNEAGGRFGAPSGSGGGDLESGARTSIPGPVSRVRAFWNRRISRPRPERQAHVITATTPRTRRVPASNNAQ
jgi:Domain of unknown function (DUF4396)